MSKISTKKYSQARRRLCLSPLQGCQGTDVAWKVTFVIIIIINSIIIIINNMIMMVLIRLVGCKGAGQR